jgi:HSP20 family protein
VGQIGAVQKVKESNAIKITGPDGFPERLQTAFDAISRRAYEIFDGNGRTHGRDLDDWLQAERELFQPVQIDVTESEESISVKTEVPGFSEKDLQVNIEPSRLIISGNHESHKEEKKGKTEYTEVCSKDVFRVVELPAEVDTAKAKATLKDGILQLTMPKAAKPRTVPIRNQAAA